MKAPKDMVLALENQVL